jgi:transposase
MLGCMNKIAVHLSDDERQELERLVGSGSRSVRLVRRAQILLRSADGLTDESLRAALGVSLQTIHNVRKQAATEGVNACLNRRAGRKAGQVAKALDGVAEAHLLALTCGEPPEGHERWTLRLLAERMVQLEYVTAVSQVLKKAKPSPGSTKNGVSRPRRTPPS